MINYFTSTVLDPKIILEWVQSKLKSDPIFHYHTDLQDIISEKKELVISLEPVLDEEKKQNVEDVQHWFLALTADGVENEVCPDIVDDGMVVVFLRVDLSKEEANEQYFKPLGYELGV